jgi:hypothetical protein
MRSSWQNSATLKLGSAMMLAGLRNNETVGLPSMRTFDPGLTWILPMESAPHYFCVETTFCVKAAAAPFDDVPRCGG